MIQTDCAVEKHLRNVTPSMPMQFPHCNACVQRHFLAQTPSLPMTIVHTCMFMKSFSISGVTSFAEKLLIASCRHHLRKEKRETLNYRVASGLD